MVQFPSRVALVVGLFVVLDLVVVVFAFDLSRRGGDTATAAAGGSPSISAPASTEAEPITGPLVLSANGDGALARVTRGSCDSRSPARARVWVSESALSTMTPRTVPGLVESLGVDYRAKDLTIVGADADCTVHGYTSTDAGATWEQGEVPRRMWWLDLDTTQSMVHGPVAGGEVDLQCVPTSVSTEGDGALLGCGASGLLRLDEQGLTRETVPVPGVTAAVTLDEDRTLLVASTNDCRTQLLVHRTDGATRVLSCPSNDAAPLGLAVAGSRWFLQAGYRLEVSTNDGRRFTDYQKDPVTAEAD